MTAAAPEFLSPPVVETVLGMQFDPIPDFTIGHLGAFWKDLGSEWPRAVGAPPLGQDIERFGSEQIWQAIGSFAKLQVSAKPQARIQIRNASNDRMVQLQNGRFFFNWLGEKGTRYARYRNIKPQFNEMVDRLNKFLSAYKLGEAKLNQWDITYVNHLPKGTVWDTPDDWNTVFASPVVVPSMIEGISLDTFTAAWHYEIKPERGRLHIELQPARTGSPDESGTDILQLRLTARGAVDLKRGYDLNSGLDLGHQMIVATFKELTSQRARIYWEEQP